jgi:outer membrane protein assembly factor BamB
MKLYAGIFLRLLLLLAAAAAGSASVQSHPQHWPQWRGPFFNGVAEGSAPLQWSDGRNVKWRTAIPGRGFSTPVVWGNRIFVTTAVPTGKGTTPPAVPDGGPRRGSANGGAGTGQEHDFVVMCLDRTSGKVLWQKTAISAVPHEGYHRTYGSFASNSPVTDGRLVYASFGSRGIYCYDFDGKLVWGKDPGVRLRIRNEFGEGAAPVLDGERLIQAYDQESGSFLLALDKTTGREIWRTPRDEVSAWSTPLVIDGGGGRQVVVSATLKTRSYDPSTGKLLWECAGLGANVIPAPVHRDGIVYVMSGHRDPKLMAIRLGRQGDLTHTDAVIWTQTRGTSYTPSPVLHEGKLYTLSDSGMVSCFDARTGNPYYLQKRLPQPDNYKASPVASAGRLYLASESGVVTVLRMGEQFEVLATNTLEGQMFVASPVVVERDLLLRSATELFCISDSGNAQAQ